jgi:mRNA interferase YafQ
MLPTASNRYPKTLPRKNWNYDAFSLPLPSRRHDHELSGDWGGYRECHVKPDLLLIYRKPDAGTLWLARLGSHSEIFG